MKKNAIIVCGLWLTVVSVLAGSLSIDNPSGGQVLNRKAVTSDSAFSEDGGAGVGVVAYKAALQDYKADKDTLQTRIINYDAKYIAMTNSIEATSGVTRTALRNTRDAIEAQQKEIIALKQMISDLKKMEKASMEME